MRNKKSRQRTASSRNIPSFNEEKALSLEGYRYIAGIDEVGRGALAGPVAAAAVILPFDIDTPWLKLVRDSKQLSPSRRESLSFDIHDMAISVGIGMIDRETIDEQGIVKATRLAMKMAVEQLVPSADTLLIDYMTIPEISLPQKGIKKGDSLSLSIACASIVAKVARDSLMIELDKTYPGYEFSRHKGYGTRTHIACLNRLGPSPVHRRSFSPVRGITERQ
jgi:ribonuclease HII